MNRRGLTQISLPVLTSANEDLSIETVDWALELEEDDFSDDQAEAEADVPEVVTEDLPPLPAASAPTDKEEKPRAAASSETAPRKKRGRKLSTSLTAEDPERYKKTRLVGSAEEVVVDLKRTVTYRDPDKPQKSEIAGNFRTRFFADFP